MRQKALVRRRALQLGVVCVSMLLSTGLEPSIAHAQAATPEGQLAPGSYPLADYVDGTSGSGSLAVSNVDYYTQTFQISSGNIELYLVGGTTNPFNLNLSQLYVGGLFFTSNGQALPNNPPPVTYRPYNTLDTLVPGQSWGWTMYSTSGGVTITDTSTVTSTSSSPYDGTGPGDLVTSGGDVPVQQIDSTWIFGGNGSGEIDVVQFETPGSASRAYAAFSGIVTALGSETDIDCSVVLGGLSD